MSSVHNDVSTIAGSADCGHEAHLGTCWPLTTQLSYCNQVSLHCGSPSFLNHAKFVDVFELYMSCFIRYYRRIASVQPYVVELNALIKRTPSVETRCDALCNRLYL
jgi:hypothetical protein